MLRKVTLHTQHTPEEYEVFLTHTEMEDLRDIAKRLNGKRIVHVNATDSGGGVAEVLGGLVSFEQGLGIASSWRVLEGVGAPFFSVTKKIHNALQGSRAVLGRDGLTSEEKKFYEEQSRDIAYALSNVEADLLLIHDPQPLLAGFYAETKARKVARIHIDLSSPEQETLQFILPRLRSYERVVFSLASYIPASFENNKAVVISPTIDPLSGKNKPMTPKEARSMLARYGVKETGPLITQVSRFDPWKDPLGVVEAHQKVRKKFPDLQLVLLGSLAVKDDPEAVEVLRTLKARVKEDSSIIIISEHSDQLVNAVQTAADVVVQKSLREGFGLTATEAMWKGKPVVAGNVGGLRFQIEDGETGFLVHSADEVADRIMKLLENPALCRAVGEKARESVRERFLLPLEVRAHLQLYADVLGV